LGKECKRSFRPGVTLERYWGEHLFFSGVSGEEVGLGGYGPFFGTSGRWTEVRLNDWVRASKKEKGTIRLRGS